MLYSLVQSCSTEEPCSIVCNLIVHTSKGEYPAPELAQPSGKKETLLYGLVHSGSLEKPCSVGWFSLVVQRNPALLSGSV